MGRTTVEFGAKAIANGVPLRTAAAAYAVGVLVALVAAHIPGGRRGFRRLLRCVMECRSPNPQCVVATGDQHGTGHAGVIEPSVATTTTTAGSACFHHDGARFQRGGLRSTPGVFRPYVA